MVDYISTDMKCELQRRVCRRRPSGGAASDSPLAERCFLFDLEAFPRELAHINIKITVNPSGRLLEDNK